MATVTEVFSRPCRWCDEGFVPVPSSVNEIAWVHPNTPVGRAICSNRTDIVENLTAGIFGGGGFTDASSEANPTNVYGDPAKPDVVHLDLSVQEYEDLVLMLGLAAGVANRGCKEFFYRCLRIANKVNEHNPNWTPYEVPALTKGKSQFKPAKPNNITRPQGVKPPPRSK
jgi:hypothetical protein